MSHEIAISVKHVAKTFQLPHEKADSIKSLFINPFSKNRKKIELQHALRDINFEIKKGEFFGIVGRNGSGKSTLLKIIAGIYKPNEGSVTINGRLVPFIELGVGFNPELTGRENTYLNGALMGFSQKEVDAKYTSIVDFAELERFMDQKLKNYSSGMQVRLAFSVATILAESDILLVDEVLAVGDADFQKKCFDYFRTLKRLQKTVIFVSHDMNAVIEYCDRAILIEDSKLVAEGNPEKIAISYQKLFQENESIHSVESSRWGDKSLTFSVPKISKKLLRDADKEFTLTVSVKASRDIDRPIFGFAVKNPSGDTIAGTNNNIKQQRVSTLKKDETLTIRWTMPNIFSDGIHSISLAADYEDGSETGDRWEDVIEFEVRKKERTPYGISPDIALHIEGSAKP